MACTAPGIAWPACSNVQTALSNPAALQCNNTAARLGGSGHSHWRKEGHGSVTLTDAVAAHEAFSLDAADTAQIVAYLQQIDDLDTEVPSEPGAFTAAGTGRYEVTLNWDASTDNVAARLLRGEA